MSDSSPSASVLFVCLGNICRSPAAEGVMGHLVASEGLDGRVRVDSAGTSAYHVGERADRRMREAAERRGYQLTSRARQVVAEDFERFDLVVAMDRSNRADLENLAGGTSAPDGRARLHLLSDFLAPDRPRDVPDPYYGGDDGFEQVLDLIEDACPALLERLLDGADEAADDGGS